MMETPTFKDRLIDLCHALSSYATKRGEANRRQDPKEFDRCDSKINGIILQIVKLVNDSS